MYLLCWDCKTLLLLLRTDTGKVMDSFSGMGMGIFTLNCWFYFHWVIVRLFSIASAYIKLSGVFLPPASNVLLVSQDSSILVFYHSFTALKESSNFPDLCKEIPGVTPSTTLLQFYATLFPVWLFVLSCWSLKFRI